MRTIFGIDPGSRVAGFGVIRSGGGQVECVDFGSLRLNLKGDFSSRIFELGQRLDELFLRHQPDEVVIEQVFLGKNADSAFKLGHARGVCMYSAVRSGAKVFEYSTRSVKQGITGQGGASKEQVQLVLCRTLGLTPSTDLDAFDALAMAVHHAYDSEVKMKLAALHHQGSIR